MLVARLLLPLLGLCRISANPHHVDGQIDLEALGAPDTRIRCDGITDIEQLCAHTAQCSTVMPDLPRLCRSFTKQKYGRDEYLEIIDFRRSEKHIISLLERSIPYNDASPPIIIQGPKNLTVTPGLAYQLECKAEGAPTPKLTITRLEEASLRRVKKKGNDIDLQLSAAHVIHKNERVQDSDEGWYRCVAANSRGVVYADSFLRVHDLCADLGCTGGKVCVPDNEAGTAECLCPECIDVSFEPLCATDCVTHFNPCQLEHKNCVYGTDFARFSDVSFCPAFTPPILTEQPEPHIFATEGKKFTLTCRAAPAGDSPGPPPLISWYRAAFAPTMESPTDEYPSESPTLGREGEPDYKEGKLGEGEVIKLRTDEDMWVYCVAHQCKYGEDFLDVVSHLINVHLKPGELNFWIGGPSCQIFGDPHVVTFDRRGYEFGGQCNYVLSMDCARRWSVYGEFESCSTHGRGSCLTGVSLHYNGVTVQMRRGFVVNKNGERVQLALGQQIQIPGEDGTSMSLYLEGVGEWAVLTFHNSYQLRWDGFMSAQILLGIDSAPTCGLCGNANGDPTDDLRLRRTNEVTESVGEFGDSWKIDRRNKCGRVEEMPAWDWEEEFAAKRPEAEDFCSTMFGGPQLTACAADWELYTEAINPAPYKEACVADYMRSDYMEGPGVNVTCIAAFNYAERCGNFGNKIHLWREETGCDGEPEELDEYLAAIQDLGCI